MKGLLLSAVLLPIVLVYAVVSRGHGNALVWPTDGATYTAGKTTVGSVMYTGQQNVLSASQIATGVEGGRLDNIAVYVGEVHAAPLNHMQVAVYTNNGENTPGDRIANSDTQVLRANSWNVFSMPSVAVAANSTYWLAFNVDGSRTQVPVTSNVARSAWKYPIKYGTWSTPYGALSRPVASSQYSIYMEHYSKPQLIEKKNNPRVAL